MLLALYLSVLFVLSRILETVAYYEGGYLASRLLDPVSLSVRRLKAILDQRGISYSGVVERTELKELIKSSGDVSSGEMEAASLSLTDEESVDVEMGSCTNFTCGTHFYEEVEDTKDSVWVVQVQCDKHRMLMQHSEWKSFVKKVSRFGVRTGIFDCSLDQRLCDKKKWFGTQLVLAMPVGYQAKDHVVLKSYSGSSHPSKILNWVNHNLASRISTIPNFDDYSQNWLHFDQRAKTEKVRVVLFSHLYIPPMFFSVLSVKFTGRVKFGSVNMSGRDGKELARKMNITRIPAYVILTPEKSHYFGSEAGEYLNYQSMALLLRTLHPEVNDMFLLSLIIVNMTCCLEFFITHGNVLKRLGRVLWDIVKWNFLLILLWLPVLGLFQLPYMDHVFSYILTTLRRLSLTPVAACIRADWLWYSSVGWVFLASTYVLFSVSVALLHYVYDDQEPASNSAETSGGFWSFQWESYMSSLLQPTTGMGRLGTSGMGNYGMDMELLIERLAVPNLWLRPMISSQYVHNLPVWKYSGPCVESDVGSDSECPLGGSTKVDSDGDDGATSSTDAAAPREFGPRPLMFICEKCRLLQGNSGAREKTPQELEQERIDSESACAKFLMDGDYKCMCGQAGGGSDHGGGGHNAPRTGRSRGSPRRGAWSRSRSTTEQDQKKAPAQEDNHQMPPGMIATIDCSICLESYKYSAVLCGLPCGHTFHQQCIMGWLNRDNHCCPICRWPAYKAKPCNIHQHAD